MELNDIIMLIVIVLYLALTIVIGIRCSRKNKSSDDFYLGGRKLGPYVTAMSAEASDMSSWLLMGLPGVAFLTGLAEASWTAIGLALGTYLNWLFVAKRLRKYSQVCNNSITVPDFFSNRFREKKKILMSIAALVIVVFFVPYTGSGFAACGKLFGTLFGVDYHVAMIISALVIIAYVCIGGFLAASTTDFMQSIVMSIALIVVFVFGIISAGGAEAVVNNASSFEGYLSLLKSANVAKNTVTDYGSITIISTLAWGLGYFGMPHILLRFMAVKDSRTLTRSRRIASIWVVISLCAGVFIGVIGLGMASSGVFNNLINIDSETAITQTAEVSETAIAQTAEVSEMVIAQTAEVSETAITQTAEVSETAIAQNAEISETAIAQTNEGSETAITSITEESKKVIEKMSESSETIIIQIAKYLSSFGIFPAIIAGIILAGILASTMSTADSQLLAASSSVSENIVKGLFKVKTTPKTSMIIARVTLILIAVVAAVIAWNPESSVFQIVSFAWAGFGAAFGPLMLFSLFWKRTNLYGAIAGMISGGAMVFIWKFLVRPLGGVFNIYELLPAFIVSTLFIIVVSLLTPKPSSEITDEFDAVKGMKSIQTETESVKA